VIPYSDEDDAIRIANESCYGLGGSVWSADHERALAVAERVTTATIGLNHYAPDIHSPMAGIKCSGLGVQLGPEAVLSFLRFPSIYL
jgi:aldehyde dehydrogenase (NAD+)